MPDSAGTFLLVFYADENGLIIIITVIIKNIYTG